jgi:hypothetical protein
MMTHPKQQQKIHQKILDITVYNNKLVITIMCEQMGCAYMDNTL